MSGLTGPLPAEKASERRASEQGAGAPAASRQLSATRRCDNPLQGGSADLKMRAVQFTLA